MTRFRELAQAHICWSRSGYSLMQCGLRASVKECRQGKGILETDKQFNGLNINCWSEIESRKKVRQEQSWSKRLGYQNSTSRIHEYFNASDQQDSQQQAFLQTLEPSRIRRLFIFSQPALLEVC
ncbi:unnamed protein product [Haemonchus placei]|uniref:Uncharacterized protein n=1 Tax=Haemonchus placei TaxID=6290 RepID=A0A0N4XBV2_HAEPC|nr:unnamed protein product [Haemonchus placei]